MNRLQWLLDKDGQAVTLTLPTDPPVALRLNSAQIDDMLRNLGDFRASMAPPHEKTWQPGRRVVAEPDPCWLTEPEIMPGNSVLHLRDPRYGWLHYLLPRDAARELGNSLVAQADRPPQGPSSRGAG
ncbi:MAG: hypothetical protein JWR21_950 [Herminiimonas sp.]|nr:hypothetical protein [Herminiimonas sp.]MDB5852395.1 hypothetical protein [Herminiimonas sp.]